MKSRIITVDALLAEEKHFPVNEPNDLSGIGIDILGFEDIQYREHPQRPISKIVDPVTIIQQ